VTGRINQVTIVNKQHQTREGSNQLHASCILPSPTTTTTPYSGGRRQLHLPPPHLIQGEEEERESRHTHKHMLTILPSFSLVLEHITSDGPWGVLFSNRYKTKKLGDNSFPWSSPYPGNVERHILYSRHSPLGPQKEQGLLATKKKDPFSFHQHKEHNLVMNDKISITRVASDETILATPMSTLGCLEHNPDAKLRSKRIVGFNLKPN